MKIVLLEAIFGLSVICAANGMPTPPPLDVAFSVPFYEEQNLTKEGVVTPLSRNYGAWYYDFVSKPPRARNDHGKGNQNNFCQCGINNNTVDEPCSLLFAEDNWMYVYYPTLDFCCRLCNTTDGCSPLKPTWISEGVNVTFMGEFSIGGSDCYSWEEPGAVATDEWATRVNDTVPCRYFEHFIFPGTTDVNFTHSLTFIQEQYLPKMPADSVFAVPLASCSNECKPSQPCF